MTPTLLPIFTHPSRTRRAECIISWGTKFRCGPGSKVCVNFFFLFRLLIDNQNMWERSSDNLGKFCYGKFVFVLQFIYCVWVRLQFDFLSYLTICMLGGQVWYWETKWRVSFYNWIGFSGNEGTFHRVRFMSIKQSNLISHFLQNSKLSVKKFRHEKICFPEKKSPSRRSLAFGHRNPNPVDIFKYLLWRRSVCV